MKTDTDLYSNLNAAKSYIVRDIDDKNIAYFALCEDTSQTELIINDPILYVFVKINQKVISVEFVLKPHNMEISNETMIVFRNHLMSIAHHCNIDVEYDKLKNISNGQWFLEFLIQE
tara:strand:- start:295 stop:645 length:351 start_codon:yes stop_codon:yes gene_type:complete